MPKMKENVMTYHDKDHHKHKAHESKMKKDSNDKRVSDHADGVKVLEKEREREGPHTKGRHEKFQFGTNPMAMTSFERELVAKEAEERREARHDYIRGIQGRDGGCYDSKYEKEYEDGPEVN